LAGPAVAPPGAITVPAGDNGSFFQGESYRDAANHGRTYYFAPGVHTIGASPFAQIIAKPGDSYIGAPGAVLDGQGLNKYAFTGSGSGVSVRHLTIQHFAAPGDEGVVNHDLAPSWTIERNKIHLNGGAGAYLGDDGVLRFNCLADNSQYGYQAAGKRITVTNNEIARNNTYDWETKTPGCGCSGGAKHWGAGPGVVSQNYVHDNQNVGLWWDNNNIGFLIEGNYIADNFGHGIEYETSYNFRIANNYLARNAWGIGKPYQDRGDPFPQAAIYISEAGGDPRLNGGVYGTSTIEGNYFLDNWNGVTLWENADRFGHDDTANTSKGYTTLVIDPSGAFGTTQMPKCSPDQINSTVSRKWDCRWRTMNVRVTDNQFIVRDRAAMGCVGSACAQQAVFSNYGSVPSWSPFLGRYIQDLDHVQAGQCVRSEHVRRWLALRSLRGVGPTLSMAQWQAAPYSQDAGSVGS
jgi:hypothetical protein